MPEVDPKPVVRFPPWLSRRAKRRARIQGQVTALDIDGAILRVVQTTPRFSGAKVSRVTAAPLELAQDADRTDPSVLGPAVARALAQLRLKPSSVVMGVPRAQVVLRTMTLPVTDDPRQLASMVHFQVGKDLPFRADEAVIDFKIRRRIEPPSPRPEAAPKTDATAPEPAVPRVEVLVAALKRTVVEFYQQLAEAAGVKLLALGLLPYANVRCVEACNVADGDETVAVVSLRPEQVNIDIIGQQALLFSRGASIKTHAEAATPAAESAPAAPAPAGSGPGAGVSPDGGGVAEFPGDRVTIEVVRTLHSYGGVEVQSPVAKMVVTGGTGQEAAVVDALSRRFSVPCHVLDLVGALDLPADAREHAPGAMAAMGLALGVHDDGGLPFDFLNPKQPLVETDRRRILILGGIAAAAAVLVGILALRSHLLNERESLLRQIEAEVADARTKQPTYQRMIRQTATVDEWVKDGRNWLEHYALLSALLPPCDEVYVTSLAITGSGTIRFNVQARSGEILAKLDKQLRAVGYDVKPLAITPGADRFGYEFRSSVELVVPDKMKIDRAKLRPPARPADDASLDPVAFRKGGAG